MSCLGYPSFYRPPLFPHFANRAEQVFYHSDRAVGELDAAVNQLVRWAQDPQSRPARFTIKDPFRAQEVSVLKLAQTTQNTNWEPYMGVLVDALDHVAREGGLNQIGYMSPWAKLFEALAIASPLSKEVQEAAEVLWDYGNVDCRFKAVVLLGYTRLRDAPSFLLEIVEKEPVLNIRANAIWSITKIGYSTQQVISTLEGMFAQGFFRDVIAGNLYRFTGDWAYLDYLVANLEEPHAQKTATILDYLEPWPRTVCSRGACANFIWFKDYWWEVHVRDPTTSFYQAYTDWQHCGIGTDICWSCFQETQWTF